MKDFHKKKKLFLLSLISALGVFSGGMISPIEMRFLSEVTGSNPLATFAFTFGTIASVLGYMSISHWTNKFGSKKILFSFLFISIFMPVIYAGVHTTLQAYGLKSAGAFMTAITGTIIWAFLQEEVSSELNCFAGTFFGILYAIQAGLGSAGTLFGGFLSDKIGFFSVFLAIAILNFIQFIILATVYKNHQSRIAQHSHNSKGALLEGAKYIWTNKELRSRFILITSFGINWSTKAILYPLILFSLTSSNTITSAVMSTQGIVAMIALPYIGIMVDKIGYSKILWIGYSILGISILAFSLSPYLWIIWIAAGLVAVGEACNGPAMAALEVKNIPDNLRNSIIAIQNLYSTFIEVITTSLTGILLAFLAPQSIMLIMATLIFLSLIVAFKTINSKKNQTPPITL